MTGLDAVTALADHYIVVYASMPQMAPYKRVPIRDILQHNPLIPSTFKGMMTLDREMVPLRMTQCFALPWHPAVNGLSYQQVGEIAAWLSCRFLYVQLPGAVQEVWGLPIMDTFFHYRAEIGYGA